MTSLHKTAPFAQLLVCLGLYFLFTLAFYGIAVGLILPKVFGISAIEFAGGDYSDPHILHVMKLFQMAYSVVAFLVPALIFFFLWHKKPFRYAGLSSRIHWGWALAGVVILFASLPGVGILSDWNQQIHFGPWDQSLRALQQRAKDVTQAMLAMPDVGSLLFDLLLIGLIPAIAEEFFFRGVIQRVLIKLTHSAWLGILIASIFFSLVHGEMLGFFPRVALGAILGLIYFYSGNLWYAVLIHFINNGFQVVLVYLFQHHYITMDLNKDTPTPLLLGLLSIFVVIGLFFIYKNKIPPNPDKVLWADPK